MKITEEIIELAYNEPEVLIDNYLYDGYFAENNNWEYIDHFYLKFPYISLLYLFKQSECDDNSFINNFCEKYNDNYCCPIKTENRRKRLVSN